MSIISPTRHHTKRPRPSETVIPVAARHLAARTRDEADVSFDDIIDAYDDATMPADWQPARGADQLDHRAVRTVLAELRADDIAAIAELRLHALRRVLAPVAALLDYTVVPSWQDNLLDALSGARLAPMDLDYAATSALDATQNSLVFGLHQLYAPVLAELDGIDAELASIAQARAELLAEVTL